MLDIDATSKMYRKKKVEFLEKLSGSIIFSSTLKEPQVLVLTSTVMMLQCLGPLKYLFLLFRFSNWFLCN